MKTPRFFLPRLRRKIAKITRSIVCGILCTGMVFTGPVMPLRAATLYWDSDGTGAGSSSLFTGSGLGAAGTWDTTNPRWWDGSAYGIWNNGNLDTALFWGTAGTITLGTPITVGGLTFNTTAYALGVAANANAITFGGTTNNIILNNVAAATINGSLAGTGSSAVVLSGGIYGGQTPGVLTLAGTGTGLTGYSGSTTINNGMTMSLTQNNRALLSTSDITLNGGGITLTNTTAGEAALDRVNNAAGITSNGGTITFTNTSGSNVYAETLGSVALTSGRLNIVETTNQGSAGSQTLTLSGLTRTGATNTSTVSFSAGSGLNTTKNMIVVTGAAATTAGQIIGPWSTVGTTAALQTDYAVYNASSQVVARATAGTGQASWTTATDAYTQSTATETLGGTRTITALRNTGTTATTALGANNLETFGLLNGATTLWTISGTGAVRQQGTAAANLFVNTGSGAITISAPVNNNTGALTLVKDGTAGTLTLSSTTSTYSGGTVINGGTLSVAADTNLGGTSGGITFNSSGTLTMSTNFTLGSGRAVIINNGALATIVGANAAGATIAGNITGTGGLIYAPAGNQTLTLSGTGSTFQGPLVVGNGSNRTATVALASLADSTTANGAIRLGTGSGTGTLQWSTSATGPLILNNRQIDLAGTTGGGTIDNSNATPANAITINTDLLISSTANPKTLTFQGANTGANTFAGRIFDSGSAVIGVTKGGTGNWTLSNANNTFTGTITLAGGTTNSGTLTLASAGGINGITFSGTTGASTLVYNGAGQTLSGAVSMASVTTGSARIDSSGAGALNLSNTGTLGVAGSGNKALTLGGTNTGDNILAGLYVNNTGGAATLTKDGVGKWILTNANTYSGATTISNGILQLGNALAVQNSAVAVTPNNGLAFSSGITNFTLGNLSGAGNLALTDTAAGAVNLSIGGNSAATSTYSGNFSGAGNLTKTGTGALVLSGTGSSNSGTVTVNGGTLSVNPSAISAATGSITVGSTVTGSVLDLYADGVAATTNLALNTNLLLGGAATSGTLGFQLGTAGGPGTSDQFVLSGTGSLTVAAGGGLINAQALSGFGAGSYDLITGAASITGAPTLGSLPGGFGYSLTTGASTVTLNVAAAVGANYYWAGDLNGSWTGFSGGGANTNWSNDAAINTDPGATPGTGQTVNFSIDTGAANLSTTLDNAFSVAGLVFRNTGSAVTINPGTGGTLTLGTGGIDVQTGAPTPVTIGAPVTLGAAQSWGVVDSGTTLAVSGVVSGANLLTKTGAGSLTLSGASTGFTGGLTIEQGTVTALTSANALGANANIVTLGDSAGGVNPATLLVGTGGLTFAQPITLASTTTGLLTIGNTGSGNTIFSGAVTGSNNVTLSNGAGAGTLTFSAPTAFNNSGIITHVDSGAAAGGLAISGIIGTNVGNVIQNSATSALTLGAVANTWTGGLTIKAGNVIGGSNANTFGGNTNIITLGDTTGSANTQLTPFNSATYLQAITVKGGNSGTATLMLGTTSGAPIWGGAITLDTHDLIIAKSGTTGATQVTGGITGTGNISLNNTGTTGTITLATGLINNTGTITNIGAPTAGTITTISANIGSSVTGVIQNSANSPLTLSGTNSSFAGGVTLTQGTLNINSATALGTGLFTITTGTINNSSAGGLALSTNPTQTWNGDFTFTGTRDLDLGTGAVSLGSTAGSRQVTVSASTLTVGGAISDGTATGLTKAGAGTLVLTGTNLYSGATAINGGILSIGSSANLGNASATNTLSMAGGTLAFTGGTVDLTSNRTVALGTGGGTFNVSGTRLTVSGVVSGANALTKSGTGTLALTGANDFTGSTLVNGGTLSASPGALATTTGILVGSTVTGSVLDLYADNAAATTNLASGTNVTLGGTGGLTGALGFQLGASGTGDQLVFSGFGSLLIGSGGVGLINASALSGFGAGTWTLASGGTNNVTTFALGSLPGGFGYSLTQSASTLSLTATAAAGANYFWAGDVNGSWSGFSGGGANTNWSNAAGSNTDPGATPGTGQTVNFSITTGAANFSTTVDSAFSIAGLNFTNAGSAVTIAPGTGGTLQLGSGGINVNTGAPTGSTISAPVILGANNTWTVTDAATTLTVSGAVSETGGVRTLGKAGSGTLVLSGANTYTGATSVTAGALNIQNAAALGTTAAGTSVSSGAALQIQGGITVGAEALSLNGTGISTTGALRNISGTNTYGGLVTLAAASRINSDAGTLTLSNAGTITGATFSLTVGGAGDTTINSIIGTTSGTLVKDGIGKLTLTNANNYTGVTTITAGVLNIQNPTATGTIAGNVTIAAGAALELQHATGITVGNEPISSIRGTGPNNGGALRNISGTNTWGGLITQAAASRVNSDSGTLILDVASGNAITGTFGLTLGGAGNGEVRDPIATSTGTLTKDGTGTWSLRPSAVNTYTGATNVNGGTLLLDFVNATPATNLINVGSILNLGGGTLSLLGKATTTNSQTFASTGLTAGTSSNVSLDKQTATSLTLAMGTLTRNANSGVNFDLANSPTVTLTLGATLSNATGIITAASSGAAVATFNKTDWATMSGSNPVAYSGYVADTFTTSTNNINVTTSGAWAGTSLNTLRFNTGAPTLTLTGVNTLDAGGILVGSGAGAVVIGGTGTLAGADATGTTASPVAGELGVFQHSATAATISAPIVNNALGLSHVAATPSGTLFNKYGTGTLILSSTRNAWTGGTNIGAGTLQLGAANVIPDGLGNPGLFSISPSGTLDMNGFSETINGLSGSGIVNNTSASPVTLTVGNGTLAGSVTSTFSGNILNSGGGALSLLKVGTGTLTLRGVNTYTGGTTLSQGGLSLDFATAGAPTTNILPATAFTLGSGTLTVTGITAATPINNTQAFSGTTLNGGGTVTMAGSTSGLTALTLGSISRAAGTGGTLNITGLSNFLTVGTTSTNNTAGILGGHVTVAGADWGTVNASGNIVALGTYTALPTAVTTDVNGNYTLAAAQTQAGTVTINSLKATGGTYTLSTGSNNIVFSGANGGLISSATALTIGAAVADTGTIGAGSGNEFIINNSGTVTLNAALNTGAGGLTKSGAGTLNLRSTATTTVTGPIVINGGTINVDADGRLGTGTSLVLNGGTLTFVADASQSRTLTLGAAGGTINVSGAGGTARNAMGATAVSFVGTGPGPRTLTINGGTTSRIWNLPAILGDSVVGTPTSFTLATSGTGTGVNPDAMIFSMTAANTYTGTTTINRGILRMGVANAISSGTGGLTSAATTGNILFNATTTTRAILETNATAGTITRSLGYGPGQIHWEGNGGFSNSSAATQIVNLGGAGDKVTWGVGGFVPTGSLLQFGSTAGNNNQNLGAINFVNAIELGTAARTIDVGTVNMVANGGLAAILSGNLTSGAGGGIVKSGIGTLLLTGNNTGGPATVNVSGGSLIFEDLAAIPGTGANITLSTTAANNAAIGMLGDTNPITTFGARLANPTTATAAFLLGADSSATLDFTGYTNMRLGAYSVRTPTATPTVPVNAVTFTGSITPAGGTYRLGGQGTSITNTQAIGTLVLGAKNQLTGTNLVNISSGGVTITATNNVSGATTLTNNGIEASILGIGSKAALGTSTITFVGGNTFRWGSVNGDQSVSNNIAWDPASTANWVPAGDAANDGILRNTNQGAMTYLGTINLAGRSNPTLTFRPGAGLFLGDFTGAATGFTYSQSTGGYFSMLSTTANGGVAKTYSGTTALGDNTNLVIDSANSLGTSGNITLGNSIILLQPGTTAVTLSRNFVNTAAKNPSFVTPEGSTLTLTGTMSGSTTGVFVKQGLGDLVLRGDATAVLTTGSLQVRSGKLVLDAATLGSTVFPNVAISLGQPSAFSNGGTLEITGTSAQSLGAVTVNQRSNNINLTGAMTLTLGAITRTTGSTLNFSMPTGSVTTTGSAIATLVNGATTWNGNDFAGLTGAGPAFTVGAASYTALSGGAPSITSAATANYHITAASGTVTLAATGTLAAPIDTNTLKYSDVAARIIDVRDSGGTSGFWRLGAGGIATGGVTNAGGILVASGSGALTIGVAPGATGGSIMAGGTTTNAGLGDLVFINNSTSDITVNSAIVNNGAAGVTSVVYDGRSTGKLILAGDNSFTGAIYVNKGTLEVASVNTTAAPGSLGQGTAAVGNILLNGGTFRANLGADGNTNKGFTVGAPSTLEVVANTLTINSTVRGVVTDDIYYYGGLNAGILRKTGAGTLELKDLAVNANNANLSIEVVAGTLFLNKTTTAAISAVDLAGSAALIIDSVASGSAPTVKIGLGSSLGTNNQVSDASSVVVKGDLAVKGVFDLNGLSETIDGLAGTGLVRSNVAGASTLTVGGNNSANLAPYTLAAAAAGMNATGLNSFGGVIEDGSGTLALTKTGSGTQILTNNNTYSGATTISAGTLQLGIANALPSGAGKSVVTIVGNNTGVAIGGSGLILAPGTLDMGGFDQAINGLDSANGGFVTNNPTLAYNVSAWTVAAGVQGTKTLTLGNSIAQNPSFNGVIQDGFSVEPEVTATGYIGAINLVKTGSNSQTLSGANTYSGSTAIRNGSVILTGGTNRLPATTAVTLGDGTDSGVLQIGGGSTVIQTLAGLATSGTGTANRVVGGNAANSTLILNQTGSSSYAGGLGGVGTNENNLNFTLQGGGTLTVDGASNTLAGTTTVQGASTLILNSALTNSAVTVGGASAGTLISNETIGGLLTVGNGGVVAPGNLLASDIGTLTLNSGLSLNNGGTLAMQIGSTATLTTPLVSDLISITGGVFTINAGGLISLTELTPALSVGALLSSVAGSNYTLINYSGASNAGSFGDFGNLGLASSVIGANNYFVTLVHNTTAKTIELNVDNARFWSGATDGQWNTSVANWSPVNPTVYLNTDKVIFQDTYPVIAGNANVVNSTIDLTTSVTPAAVSFNNTAINYTLSGSGDIGGPTGLTKSGTGSLTITNANTFTGNTVISGGYIEMQNAAALGTTVGSITVGNGAALRLSGGTAVGAKATSLTGDGISSTGALRNVSGNNSFAGAITLTGNTRINSDAGLLTLSGGITNGANNLTLGGAGDITESGVIGSGAGTLTVDGTGTVTLSNAANTYTGQTFIKNGTLSVPNIGSVGVAGGLGAPAITEATIAIGDGANTGTLKWTGSSGESTDRVIDLAGTTGGAVLDASGSGSNVLTLATAMTFSGLGNKTLTLTGTGGSTGTPNVITGAIGDPSGFATNLLKTGTGVWRLDGSNTYTGTTTINAGTLLFGANQTLAGVTLGGAAGASATLGLGSTSIATLSGNVTFDATNNPLGASITGSGSATMDLDAAARTFTVGSSSNSGGADLTISAVIADAATGGSLVKAGAGTLVLTGVNTYAGATTVNGGVLSVNPAALGSTLTINVGTTASAELNLYADGSATPVTLASGANLNVGGASTNGYLGFNLSGASSSDAITLAGGGVLTIGNAGGIINARAVSALTGSSYLLLDRTNIGGSIPINTTNGFFLGALPGGYSYSLDNTTVGQLSLTVGSAAAGPYYWTGLRTTDSWAELGSGGATSNWATNQLGTLDAGATPGAITVIFSGDNAGAGAINTTLDQAYSITGLQFIGNTPATGNVSIAPGAGRGTLTLGSGGIDIQTGASSTSTTISAPVILGAAQSWGVTDSGQTLTVSGVVSGNGNLLTKTGAGTLVLSGVNTFDGGTSITGGTVQIAADTGLGATSGAAAINGATLQLTGTGNSVTTTRNFNLGSTGATITVDGTNVYTLNGTLANITTLGTLAANGTGTLALLGTNTYDGGTTLSGGGTVRVNTVNGLGSGALTINAGALRVSGTYSDGRNVTLGNAASAISVDAGQTLTIANTASTKVTGAGQLNASGAGTLVLDDTALVNDYTGPTVVTGGGIVQIASNTALGNTSGTVTLNNGTLSLTGPGSTSVTTARNFSLGSTGGTITVGASDTYTLNGALSNLTTLGKLTANGAGILQLFGTNTYDGGTTIGASALVNTGTVQVNTVDSLGASSGTATIRNATLQATQDITETRNFLLDSYGSKFSVDSTKTYTVGGLVADGTQAGTLNKIGAGTLNLTRAAGNTYTGGTFVTGGGTLRVNNTSNSGTGTGAVSVTGAGSTLAGTGIISGATTIGSGAILAPGNSAGTITLANLTLASGSLLSYELGPIATSDKTVVTATNGFTANGGQFTLTGLAGLTNGTYNLITYAGTLGGSFSNLSLASNYVTGGGNTYYAALVNNTGSVDLTTTNNMTWNGNVGGQVWDSGVTANTNWKIPSPATTNLNFFDTMVANFDDTATSFTANVDALGVNPSAIIVNAANDYIFQGAGAIGGASTTLTKSNSGNLTISNANTFGGVTAINGGSITMQDAAALGTTGNITIANGASLLLDESTGINLGTRITAGTGTGFDGNGFLQNLQGTNTVNSNFALTSASRISAVSGTLNLGGDFSGSSTALALAVGTGDTGNLNLSGASVSIANANFTVTNSGSGNVTVGNTVAVGTSAVVLNGTGTTTLNGNLTSSSTTNGLQISSSGTNTINANVSVTGTAGGLSIGGSATTTFGAASVTSWNATGTAAISSSGNTTFNGTISGSGALTKTGTGILTLAGNSTAYNGNIAVNGGILRISDGGSLGTTTGTTTVASGAVLEIQNNLTSAENLTLAGTGIAGTGAVRNLGGNNTLGGTITLSAATALQSDAGTLTLSNTISGSQNLTVEGVGNTTLSGAITTATGTLTKLDAGTLVLSGSSANTYSGLTTVSGGTLELAKTAGVNAIAGNLTVASGGHLVQLTSSNQIADTSLVTLNGTGANAAILRLNNQSETIGGLIGGAGEGIVENESGSAGTGTLTVNVSPGTQTFGGVIRDGDGSGTDGTLAFVKAGAGILVLSGTNSYTGATTITAGTISISSEANLGANPGSFNAAQLQLNGGTLATTATFTIDDANRGVTLGSSGGTFNTADTTTLTIANVVTGSGGLTKTGDGTLAVTGTNSYTGETIINDGIFIVDGNNSGATGDVTIGAAAMLGGEGTVGGNTQVFGTISTGANPDGVDVGTLNFNSKNLSFETGSTWFVDLVQDNDGMSDLIDNVGVFTIGSSTTLSLIPDGSLFTPDHIYTIASYSSRVGTFSNFADGAIISGYQINYGDTSITLTAVPEPGTLGLLGLALGGFFFRRLRKRREVVAAVVESREENV